MDASDFARSYAVLGQLFPNADIRRQEFEVIQWHVNTVTRMGRRSPTFSTAQRVAALAQAAAEEDRATADTILRSWGIRR